jgi:hypothetical protein
VDGARRIPTGAEEEARTGEDVARRHADREAQMASLSLREGSSRGELLTTTLRSR